MVHVSSQATRQKAVVEEHEGRGKQSGASFHHFPALEGQRKEELTNLVCNPSIS